MGFTIIWLSPQSTAGEKILWPLWTLRQVFRDISLTQEVRPEVIWLTGGDVWKQVKRRKFSPLLSGAGVRLDALRAREWPRGAGGGGRETKPSLLSGSGSSWSAGLTTWSTMMDWERGKIYINRTLCVWTFDQMQTGTEFLHVGAHWLFAPEASEPYSWLQSIFGSTCL